MVLEDDPGKDLGLLRQPGHRFFYGLDEVEPLKEASRMKRILIAGIGNIFHGDDAFGVEVVQELLKQPQRARASASLILAFALTISPMR